MAEALGKRAYVRMTGQETFHDAGKELGFNLLSFWRWSASDLLSNTLRGILAEYLVAQATGFCDDGVRDPWAPSDIRTKTGIRVEVKSGAYLQSWFQRKHSNILFTTRRTRYFDAEANVMDSIARHQAEVYVFALLTTRDKSMVDPLDVAQWEFYVVPTEQLEARERSQHSITLPSLQAIAKPVRYEELVEAIETAAAGIKKSLNEDPGLGARCGVPAALLSETTPLNRKGRD